MTGIWDISASHDALGSYKESLSFVCMSTVCARGRRESPARPSAPFKWSNADLPLLRCWIFIFSHRRGTAAVRAFSTSFCQYASILTWTDHPMGERTSHPLLKLLTRLSSSVEVVLVYVMGTLSQEMDGVCQFFSRGLPKPSDSSQYLAITAWSRGEGRGTAKNFQHLGFGTMSVLWLGNIFQCANN